MTCVTTMRYSVNLNGTILDSFARSRVLRQGDPVSPYVFLFVADGLSALFEKEKALKNVTPRKICRYAPGILHLPFADDTLLFFKASYEQASEVKSILNVYATVMGQLLNTNKCSILFGFACPLNQHDTIWVVLQLS